MLYTLVLQEINEWTKRTGRKRYTCNMYEWMNDNKIGRYTIIQFIHTEKKEEDKRLERGNRTGVFYLTINSGPLVL